VIKNAFCGIVPSLLTCVHVYFTKSQPRVKFQRTEATMPSPMRKSTNVYRLDVERIRSEIKEHGVTPELHRSLRKAKNRLSAHNARKKQHMEHRSLRAENELLRTRNEHLSIILSHLQNGILNSDCSHSIKDRLMKIAARATNDSYAQCPPNDDTFSLRDVKREPLEAFGIADSDDNYMSGNDSSNHSMLDENQVGDWWAHDILAS
jgi:hypothetical protein